MINTGPEVKNGNIASEFTKGVTSNNNKEITNVPKTYPAIANLSASSSSEFVKYLNILLTPMTNATMKKIAPNRPLLTMLSNNQILETS